MVAINQKIDQIFGLKKFTFGSFWPKMAIFVILMFFLISNFKNGCNIPKNWQKYDKNSHFWPKMTKIEFFWTNFGSIFWNIATIFQI